MITRPLDTVLPGRMSSRRRLDYPLRRTFLILNSPRSIGPPAQTAGQAGTENILGRIHIAILFMTAMPAAIRAFIQANLYIGFPEAHRTGLRCIMRRYFQQHAAGA